MAISSRVIPLEVERILQRRRAGLMKTYAPLVGLVVLVFAGAEYFFNNNPGLALTLLASAGAALFVSLGSQSALNSDFLIFASLASAFLLMIAFILNGGIQGTAILWDFSWPAAAFFLSGRRRGIIWVLTLYVTAGIIIGLHLLNYIGLPYSLAFLRQIFFIHLLITALFYVAEKNREDYEHFAQAKTLALGESNSQLFKEVQTRKAVERQLSGQLEEIKKTREALLRALKDLEAAKDRSEETRAKDEAVLGSIGEGLVVTDEQGLVLVINHSALQMLQLPAEQAVGQPFDRLIQVADEKQNGIMFYEQVMKNLPSSSQLFFDNYVLARKNGEWFPAAITATSFLFRAKVAGMISVFRDITKEKEIDHAKNEFVSLASHQLRTPLSTIRWYTEMLMHGDGGAVSEQQQTYLKEIYHGNKRMIDLVNSLLNVSRIDLGTFIIDVEQVNLPELGQSVLKELAPQVRAKGLKVTEYYDPALPILPADSKLVRIIIQNLMSNAVKYTPEEGKVALSIAVKSGDQIPSADRQRRFVVISATDTGYGVPENQKDKIFSKLFRADNVKEKETDGNGLGLYLVKAIITEAGGRVWFESEVNKGSTFYVAIPIEGMKPKKGEKSLD